MRKRGNVVVNKEYNPRNVKPDIPVDVDEVDSAMERFIRQKYEFRTLEDGKPKPPSRDDSGYHTQKSFDESPPPPIPPKSGRKFGFGLRSVSSTSHLPRHSDKSAQSPRSATLGAFSPSLNKQSRVFGANVGEEHNLEAKLDQLKEMGFPNHKRNSSVLKGVGGDLNRAVETLVRLGEGGPPQLTAPRKPSTAASLPTPSAPKPADDPWSLTETVSSSAGAHTTPSPAKPYNPFDVPNTQNSSTTSLENAFQNMQVAQPPLSPHTTGGYVSHQLSGNIPRPQLQTSHSYTSSPQPMSYNPFFQAASPASQTTQPYFGSQTAQSTPIQPTRSFSPGNPYSNSLSAQSTGAQQNLAGSQSQRFAMPRHANTMPVFPSSPQNVAPASMFFPQSQQLQVSSPQSVSSTNPFDAAPNNNIYNNVNNYAINFQQPQHPQQQNPYAQFQQPAMQQPVKQDKNSILALYNLAPATAPAMSTIPEQSQAPQTQPANPQQGIAQNLGTTPSNPYSAPIGSSGQTVQPQISYNGMSATPQSNATAGSVQALPSSNPFMSSAPQQPQQPQQLQQQQQSINPFGIMAPQSTPAAGQPNGVKPGGGSGLAAAAAAPVPAAPPILQQPQPPPPTTTQQVNNFMPRAPLHMSKASVDINNLHNGRHSPDAFASLSARYA